MPHLNVRGQVAHGVGGKLASVDNVAFSPGAVFGFDGDDTVIFANGSDNWIVSRYNLQTKQVFRVYDVGANIGYSGGGTIATQLMSNDATRGVYSNVGFRAVDAGLTDVTPDGSIVYRTQYHSNGPTLVRDQAGSEWQLTGSVPSSIHSLGSNRFIWLERNKDVKTANMQLPVTITGNKYMIHAVEITGKWWVAYYTDSKGIVFHPFDSLTGYSVLPKGDGWFTVKVMADGIVRFAISKGEGQQPGDIWVRDYDLINELQRDSWSVSSWSPAIKTNFGDVINPPSTTGDPMYKSFERPMWVAPFYSHSVRYGDTTDHVGNAIWVEGPEMGRAAAFGYPLIVDVPAHVDQAALNVTIAWWVSGATSDELGDKVKQAHNLPEKAIIAYLDKGQAVDWPSSRPDWVTDRVWPSVMAYRDPNEPLAVFDIRVTSMLERVTSYKPIGIALTPAFYTRNGQTSAEHILECIPLYEKWINTFNIVCFMPFADRRPTGMIDNPEFREHARAFFYAAPSGRPNRFDYWRGSNDKPEDVLKNKLGQSRAAIVLEPYLRDYILEEIDDSTPPPPIDEPPDVTDLDRFMRDQWDADGMHQKTQDTPESELATLHGRWFHQMIGKWHHTHGHTDVMLLPKPAGHNVDGLSEDVYVIGVPNEWLYWDDAGVSFGGKNASVGTSNGDLAKSGEPHRWAIPPKP